MKKNGVHSAPPCVAPDASSGRRARNEALPGGSNSQEHGALTRRCAPRGGGGAHPYTNGLAEIA
jgi:hypothetical protein